LGGAFRRDPVTGAVLDSVATIANPVTGEQVVAPPYLERPVRFRFTDRESQIVGMRSTLAATGGPFKYDSARADFAYTATSGGLPREARLTVPS
jgi:hypothetical protein